MRTTLLMALLFLQIACSKKEDKNLHATPPLPPAPTFTQDGNITGSWLLDSIINKTDTLVFKHEANHNGWWGLPLSDSICFSVDSFVCYYYIYYSNSYQKINTTALVWDTNGDSLYIRLWDHSSNWVEYQYSITNGVLSLKYEIIYTYFYHKL